MGDGSGQAFGAGLARMPMTRKDGCGAGVAYAEVLIPGPEGAGEDHADNDPHLDSQGKGERQYAEQDPEDEGMYQWKILT